MNTLREARRNAGLTLQALADKSGLSMETISKLENHKRQPNFRTLNKLAPVLGVSVATLVGELEALHIPALGPEETLTLRGDLVYWTGPGGRWSVRKKPTA